MCEICLKLTIKTSERDAILVSLLLTLNRFHTLCFGVSIFNLEQVNAGWEQGPYKFI